MAETGFSVTYDGPALADGRMPVRDLAPALLAMGDLFAQASTLTYPDRQPVALSIRATQKGSFFVDLVLQTESTWDQLVDIFGSDGASALVNLKELVIGAGGLFWLIRRLKGRQIASRKPAPEPGHIVLTLDDQTTVEVPAEVLAMYGNISVRQQARAVVEPLTRTGVTQLEFRSDKKLTVAVEGDAVKAFDLPSLDEITLLDHEVDMVVAIASVAFTEGNKWRFTDGDRTFFAALEDRAFLARVEGGQPFRSGDMLRCRMRVIQLQTAEGLRTEYHVLEVVEHIPRPTQLQLGEEE